MGMTRRPVEPDGPAVTAVSLCSVRFVSRSRHIPSSVPPVLLLSLTPFAATPGERRGHVCGYPGAPWLFCSPSPILSGATPSHRSIPPASSVRVEYSTCIARRRIIGSDQGRPRATFAGQGQGPSAAARSSRTERSTPGAWDDFGNIVVVEEPPGTSDPTRRSTRRAGARTDGRLRRQDPQGRARGKPTSAASPTAGDDFFDQRDAADKGAGTSAMDLHANGAEKEGFDFELMLNLGMPTAAAAQSGMSCPGSRTPPDAQGGAGAPSAARNGATYPDVLVDLPLISPTHPAATWNGAAYTDWLAAHLSSSSGGRTPHHQAVHDGAPCPDTDGLIMAQLRSGAAPTAPWNAALCPDLSPAAWNGGAYPAVAMTLDTNAAEAGLGSQRPRPTATAAAATEESRGGGYCHHHHHHHHSGDMAVPFSAQVVVDEPEDSDSLVKDSAVAQQDEDEDEDVDEVAGAVAEPELGGVGGQLGAAAMTLAVAGLTAGGEVNPLTAVSLFLMLIAGVTLVTVRVVRG
ncbi:hypothetical protein U9M48_040609 [Paspalum notatum var. saurae]|uniref:Uncharacterized protein n=1 Tax=Paspalum notatum var. saurae TaxID=547442 RepID=A0AAQ3UR04_PASNO